MLLFVLLSACSTQVVALDPAILASTDEADCGCGVLFAACADTLEQSYGTCLAECSDAQDLAVSLEQCRLSWADEASAAETGSDRSVACASAASCAGP